MFINFLQQKSCLNILGVLLIEKLIQTTTTVNTCMVNANPALNNQPMLLEIVLDILQNMNICFLKFKNLLTIFLLKLSLVVVSNFRLQSNVQTNKQKYSHGSESAPINLFDYTNMFISNCSQPSFI